MNKVDLLIEGYATVGSNGWRASSSTCLVTTPMNVKIITDPGANKELLLKSLKEKKLKIEDIEYVFLTHFHLDHSLLTGIFSKSKIINYEAITQGDKGKLVGKVIPGTTIDIIKTPGHEYAHASLIVPTIEGKIAIAGDNFWWTTEETQTFDIGKEDSFAEDMSQLITSRKKVIELADYIIPGHGKKFKVKK